MKKSLRWKHWECLEDHEPSQEPLLFHKPELLWKGFILFKFKALCCSDEACLKPGPRVCSPWCEKGLGQHMEEKSHTWIPCMGTMGMATAWTQRWRWTTVISFSEALLPRSVGLLQLQLPWVWGSSLEFKYGLPQLVGLLLVIYNIIFPSAQYCFLPALCRCWSIIYTLSPHMLLPNKLCLVGFEAVPGVGI